MSPIHSKPFAELEQKAPATKKNYKQGIKLWNDFAKKQKDVPKLDDWMHEQLTEDKGVMLKSHFSSFASFLLTYKQNNGKHYAPDVMIQNLSNAKSALVHKFKHSGGRTLPEVLKEKSWEHEWYTELRVSLPRSLKLSCFVLFCI